MRGLPQDLKSDIPVNGDAYVSLRSTEDPKYLKFFISVPHFSWGVRENVGNGVSLSKYVHQDSPQNDYSKNVFVHQTCFVALNTGKLTPFPNLSESRSLIVQHRQERSDSNSQDSMQGPFNSISICSKSASNKLAASIDTHDLHFATTFS